jgi:hypothetical protein
MMDPRYPSDDLFRLPGRRHIAVLVRKANDAVAVGDIVPFGVRPERIERDPEWLVARGRRFLFGSARRCQPGPEARVPCWTRCRPQTGHRSAPTGWHADWRCRRHHLDRKTGRILTEKPAGTFGLTPAGSGATSLKLGVVLRIGARSRGVNRRLIPGLSWCHEPKAASPFSSVPFHPHPRTNSITTARGHPRRQATCNPACHDGRRFWQAAGTQRAKIDDNQRCSCAGGPLYPNVVDLTSRLVPCKGQFGSESINIPAGSLS